MSSSIFLHIIGFVLLGGFLLALFGLNKDRELPMDVIRVGGGGGNLEGIGNNRGSGVLPGKEAIDEKEKVQSESITKHLNPQELIKPQPKQPDLDLSKNDSSRPIDTAAADSRLTAASERLRQKVAGIVAGKGQGGTGQGGGQGTGVGTGKGSGVGPGTGSLNQREKRQLRWTMIFNTRSGDDYADQLHGLGAILAIPGPDGEYLVIRDLDRRHRPVQARKEDIKELNRIYWVDDKPQSVHSLAQALGIRPVPDHVVAFFPPELEKELLEKELKAFRGKEDDIAETTFKVERLFGRYVPVVERQKAR
ncbi:MAG TPA: hypothetical protein VKU02_11930 [Gemmataceae bacterium]|nr:hypothetical protein [Gemmataceae bacterium]